MKRIALSFATIIFCAFPASADWLITTQGARIETRGPWKTQGKLLMFTRPDGTLASLRVAEVDLEASARATEAARIPEVSAPVVPDQTQKPRRVVTDKDLRTGAKDPASGGVKTFPIARHGQLQMTLPPGWTSDVRTPSEDLPPTIFLQVGTNQPTKLIVTVLWSPNGDPDFATPDWIRDALETVGKQLLVTAVESEIRLNPLRSSSGEGYWFSVTDRAPKPGEFEFMTQGGLPAGEFLLSFTVLSHQAPPRGIQQALAALITATQKK